MELNLEAQSTVRTQISIKGGVKRVGLKYDLPNKDLTQDRSSLSQEELLVAATTLLHDIADSLNHQKIETNITNIHQEWIPSLLYFLSLVNYTSFKELYSDLVVGTSYQQETNRNLFLEVLPLIGTHDAVLLIRDLVMGRNLKNTTATKLIAEFPLSIRNPTEQLLKDIEIVLTLPEDSVLHSSAVLAFATVVNKVCQISCSPDILDRYVGKYLDLFATSDTYEKQTLYLKALGNFELQRVTHYLMPIIQGSNTKYSLNIRFQAVWATWAHVTLQPLEIYKVYWPLFRNPEEALVMRIAALTMLLNSRPTTDRFYLIMTVMMEESDTHLRHFWYTTLQSLIRTKYPCYSHMVDLAKKVVRFFPEPNVHHWATGNYIFDYTDPDYGVGSLINLFVVANPQNGLPSLLFLDMSDYEGIYRYNQYSIYLRLDGIGDIIKQKFIENIPTTKKLVDLLKQLRLPTKISEQLHIELALTVQGKVVFLDHINGSTLHALSGALNNIDHIMNSGIHLNDQTVISPLQVEEVLATDIGTTAFFHMSSSWLVSFRSNLTVGRQVSSQLDLRSYMHSQTVLAHYNPVLNQWHEVQRLFNLQTIYPFNIQLLIQPVNNGVKYTTNKIPGEEIGLVAHVETIVHTRRFPVATDLNSQKPTSSKKFIVTGSKEYPTLRKLVDIKLISHLQLALLDCEHSYHRDDFSELIQHIKGLQNYNLFPALSPILFLMHLNDILTLVVLPSGSCGILLKSALELLEPTQFDVELQVSRISNDSLNLSVEENLIITKNSSPFWELDVKATYIHSLSEYCLSTKLYSNNSYIASVNLTATFPQPCTEKSFLSDVQPHSATVEINMEWKDSNVKVLVTGEVTPEQQDLATNAIYWPYNACQDDLKDTMQWGEQYIPLTVACYQMTKELSTLRKYTFCSSSNKLPLDDIKIELEVPQNGQSTFKINGHRKVLDSATNYILQPWLINTQFPPTIQFATYMGAIGTCVLTTRSAWTLDGANLNVSASTCYSLALGDCSNNPQFSVLMKKLDKTLFPLALKVISGSNFIEILPTFKTLTISVNGKSVKNLQEDYQFQLPPEGSKYEFKVWQKSDGLVHIHLAASHLWIEYYGHFATATVLGIYHGALCGLCGDHNGIPNDDSDHLYTLQCSEQT